MEEENSTMICNHPDCTFSQTGSCMLNNEPITCAERLDSLEIVSKATEIVSGDIILDSPLEFERFSSSFSLVVEDAEKMMRSRYCKVVGILGVPGTGKTASLASLYLLLAHGRLNGFKFMDSKSVRAFEEITGGTRRWNSSNLPEQLTAHTEMQDERIAGYLHLRIKNVEDEGKVDLLLTDLPGEWTLTLLDSNRTDRLAFLKSSERIWITLNAEHLKSGETRRFTIHRTRVLLERLMVFLGGDVPDICLVLTHCDKSDSVKNHLSDLLEEFDNINIKIFEIASFSENPDIPPGFGLEELIKDLVKMRRKSTFDLATPSIFDATVRNMLKFQNFISDD